MVPASGQQIQSPRDSTLRHYDTTTLQHCDPTTWTMMTTSTHTHSHSHTHQICRVLFCFILFCSVWGPIQSKSGRPSVGDHVSFFLFDSFVLPHESMAWPSRLFLSFPFSVFYSFSFSVSPLRSLFSGLSSPVSVCFKAWHLCYVSI